MSHTKYCHMACSAALDLLDELNEHTDCPWHLRDMSDSAATGISVKAYHYQDDSGNEFAVTGGTYRELYFSIVESIEMLQVVRYKELSE